MTSCNFPPNQAIERSARRWLAATLMAVCGLWLVGWAAAAWWAISPDRWFPDQPTLEDAFFGFRRRPVSVVERLLTAAQGPLNGSGSMRPAFTELSEDWDATVASLALAQRAILLEEREGERQALLDWVRQGASREAYARDDYPLSPAATVSRITPAFRVDTGAAHGEARPSRVRIASLINARCAGCHRENGRHEKARWFPLDSYELLRPYLQPPPPDRPGWLLLAWLGLLPAAATVCVARYAVVPGQTKGLRVWALPGLVQLAAVAAWWAAAPDAGWAVWLYVAGWLVALGMAGQLAALAAALCSGAKGAPPGASSGTAPTSPIPDDR